MLSFLYRQSATLKGFFIKNEKKSGVLPNLALRKDMLIQSQADLEAHVKKFKDAEFLTVDTEFLREKTYYPKLCLIQIGDPDKNAIAIDPLNTDINLRPVFELLFNPDILKIFHAGRQDMQIFFELTGKIVTPIFDTQIAAMVCGYGDQVGYESLVRNISDIQIDKSAQFTDWSHRPLSDRQIEYALGDVTHLVDVYKSLRAELDKSGRTNWVFEEEEILNDPKTYQVDPYECWQRIKIKTPKPKTLAILRELAAWREKEAQRLDKPKNWVLRDDTLADMAALAPRDVNKLKRVRNFSDDMARGKVGRELLHIIKKAETSPKDTWPKVIRKKPIEPSVQSVAEALRMLLKIISHDSNVAPKLIADRDDIDTLAKDDEADIPALRGWRLELFGKHALAMKRGELAIGLKDSKIVIYRIDDQSQVF